jgi:uncharacterized cupin superfamily protein
MSKTDRPDCIAHWSDIERSRPGQYRSDSELLSVGARLGQHFGLKRLGINHERLPPGRRTSYPHAESHEEEFVYVLSGTPDVWLDGTLHRLKPGDAVGFPAGTGLCHSFINNTEEEVTLLVVGETDKKENRIYYPLNPEQQSRPDWWADSPKRPLGDHDGLPDKLRTERGA